MPDEHDRVFLAIKEECQKQKQLMEIHSFAAIAKKAQVKPNALDTHLNNLQNLGFIRYSIPENYIYLTAMGLKHDRLPADEPKKKVAKKLV